MPNLGARAGLVIGSCAKKAQYFIVDNDIRFIAFTLSRPMDTTARLRTQLSRVYSDNCVLNISLFTTLSGSTLRFAGSVELDTGQEKCEGRRSIRNACPCEAACLSGGPTSRIDPAAAMPRRPRGPQCISRLSCLDNSLFQPV